MKGLLIKELITNIKTNKLSLLIIPAFAIFGILNEQNMFLMIIPMLLSMLPLGQMSYDEMSHWNQYVYCMPVSKKAIVSSKYISVLIMAVFSALFVGIIILFVNHKSPSVYNEMLLMSVIAFLTGALVPCISLPINYKFGTTKGRIIYLIIVGLFCGIVPGVMLSNSKKITEKAMNLLSSPALFCALSVGVLAVMLFISWLLSVKIYESKEI
ncbi:ABC-2 transporter permease [Ruminococcus sp.]|uniref:ABC-2 transporter permease n=1 Tax=Ruminococcus sp. TaxID=41978 RepID=UPI0025F370BC|nr:ABC-2 transporter permease [Ruminococcus sp.]MCR4639158.1 ABC-2 transporter permease [Ruminococcus sp.]